MKTPKDIATALAKECQYFPADKISEIALRAIEARDAEWRTRVVNPRLVHEAMQSAKIDDQLYRQARAAIACIVGGDV